MEIEKVINVRNEALDELAEYFRGKYQDSKRVLDRICDEDDSELLEAYYEGQRCLCRRAISIINAKAKLPLL